LYAVSRALQAEYCIVGIPHNTAIWFEDELPVKRYCGFSSNVTVKI